MDYVIARERHADGNHHLHACIEYEQVLRKPSNYLDFEGKHPNKQDPRNWAACKTDCRKENDFIEGAEAMLPRHKHRLDLAVEACKYEKKLDWASYCASEGIGFQYME